METHSTHEAYANSREKGEFQRQLACKGTQPTNFSRHVGTHSNPLEKLTNESKGFVLRI